MFLQVDGTIYVVDFTYDRKVPIQLTHCSAGILKNPEEFLEYVRQRKEKKTDVKYNYEVTVLGYGTAECVPSDTFKKSTGRKISMLRALKSAGFDKNLRKKIWDVFFQQAKK